MSWLTHGISIKWPQYRGTSYPAIPYFPRHPFTAHMNLKLVCRSYERLLQSNRTMTSVISVVSFDAILSVQCCLLGRAALHTERCPWLRRSTNKPPTSLLFPQLSANTLGVPATSLRNLYRLITSVSDPTYLQLFMVAHLHDIAESTMSEVEIAVREHCIHMSRTSPLC